MAKFITTRWDTEVNLDYVVQVVQNRDTGKHDLLDADGHCLGSVDASYGLPIDTLLAPIIPAAAGAWVYVFTNYADRARPTKDHITSERSQVIAWHAVDQYPEPILLEPVCHNQTIMFPEPDGRVVHRFVSYYDDLNSALAGFLENCQSDWDRDHPQPVKRLLTD